MFAGIISTIDAAHNYIATQKRVASVANLRAIQTGQMKSLNASLGELAGITLTEATDFTNHLRDEGPWSLQQLEILGVTIDGLVHKTNAAAKRKVRAPQSCPWVENYLNDPLWNYCLDETKPRHARIARIVSFLQSIHMPCPDVS